MAKNHRQQQVLALAEALGDNLWQRKWRVATAESCTGGGISAAITAIAGSSNWFEYGFITYANRAKQSLLQVDSLTLREEGAVSEPVVQQMAKGALALSGANIAVAVSGIAGPGGGSADKPVGTVWFAWAEATGRCVTSCHYLDGARADIQQQAVILALEGLLLQLGAHLQKPE